jgi:methenyltetrahydromethanopterin cyclohydrolase
MVELAAYHEIGTVHALGLAELTCQTDRNIRLGALQICIEQLKIFGIAAGKAGGSIADHDFDGIVSGGHRLNS